MKKVILSLVFVFSLMSFTQKAQLNNISNENLFSPECYDVAEAAVAEAQFYAQYTSGWWQLPGEPLGLEEQYDVFAKAYDQCDDTYNDEFQFPPY